MPSLGLAFGAVALVSLPLAGAPFHDARCGTDGPHSALQDPAMENRGLTSGKHDEMCSFGGGLATSCCTLLTAEPSFVVVVTRRNLQPVLIRYGTQWWTSTMASRS